MLVSSESTPYRVEVTPIVRSDYEELKKIWVSSKPGLAHSNSPACLVDELVDRKINLFKVFDEGTLVAYFPFETTSFFGINIITPAYGELTLDFIDICCDEEIEEDIVKVLIDWIKSLKNSVVYLFMLDENSTLVKRAVEDSLLKVEARGKYFRLNLPTTKEELVSAFSKSSKKSFSRQLKKFEGQMKFEVVRGDVLGDELENAIDDLVRLHKIVFPHDSAMLPHLEALKPWIRKAFADEAAFLVRAREISSGEIVATELMMETKKTIGLMQGGRKLDEQYVGVGSWLLNQTVLWAIESQKSSFEFLFGDQEYKRRLANMSREAVSITYFSSNKAQYLFKIKHRLGKSLKFLR